MSSHQKFLEAIVSNPFSEDPRLVYADWLEEQGDPRGDLIRLQCEMARSEVIEMDAWRREKEILEEHAARWLSVMDPVKDPPKPEFVRGLVKRWATTPTEFMAKRTQPIAKEFLTTLGLETLYFRRPVKQTNKLASCTLLNHIFRLAWSNCELEDEQLAELGDSAALANLRCLALSQTRCGDSGLKSLASSAHLQQVEDLAITDPINGGNFGAEGVAAVVKGLQNLSSLTISSAWAVNLGDFVDDCGDALPRLFSLRLVDVGSFADLLENAQLPKLEQLHLDVAHGNTNALTGRMLEQLLDEDRWPNLKELKLPKLEQLPDSVLIQLGARYDLTLATPGWGKYALADTSDNSQW